MAISGCKFRVGDKVWKLAGDYTFEGLVVSVFEKANRIGHDCKAPVLAPSVDSARCGAVRA